jgi:hypothetical protein
VVELLWDLHIIHHTLPFCQALFFSNSGRLDETQYLKSENAGKTQNIIAGIKKAGGAFILPRPVILS